MVSDTIRFQIKNQIIYDQSSIESRKRYGQAWLKSNVQNLHQQSQLSRRHGKILIFFGQKSLLTFLDRQT